MGTKPENVRYEAKQRAMGFVRGPRITAEAAEALRVLAYRHRMDPWQVVSVLLLDAIERPGLEACAVAADSDARARMVMVAHRMSLEEAHEYLRHDNGQ